MFEDEREDDPREEGAPEASAPEQPDAEEATPADDSPAPEPAEEPVAEEAAAEAPAAEDPVAEEPAAEDPAAEDPAAEHPVAEEPAAEEPAAEHPAADEPAADEPAAEEPAAEEPAAQEPAAEETAEQPPRGRGGREGQGDDQPDVIPGAHLEPDLVLDEGQPDPFGERSAAEIKAAEDALAAEPEGTVAEPADGEPVAAPTAMLDLAADARYQATGKRKRAVARVILKPGSGAYTINGRELDQFFPRATLQRTARGPLETAGQQGRLDVVAKIHGGGVSSQAGALRHGIARALVEADPNLRGELKRRGFLTRDPRVKERKKAGLKKARKRPQFSKR